MSRRTAHPQLSDDAADYLEALALRIPYQPHPRGEQKTKTRLVMMVWNASLAIAITVAVCGILIATRPSTAPPPTRPAKPPCYYVSDHRIVVPVPCAEVSKPG